MSLHQKIKWWKRINPARIDLQNNHYWIKEIFRHYNRLDAAVSKHTREAKEKYSIRKESNKQFCFTPKEIDIKDKVIEAAKT